MHFLSCMFNLKSYFDGESQKIFQLSTFRNINVLRSDTSVHIAIPPTQTPEKD